MKPREQNKFTNRKKERKKERQNSEREKVSSNERIETKWFWRETLRNERRSWRTTSYSSSNILNIVSHFSSSKMMMLLSSCVPISDS